MYIYKKMMRLPPGLNHASVVWRSWNQEARVLFAWSTSRKLRCAHQGGTKSGRRLGYSAGNQEGGVLRQACRGGVVNLNGKKCAHQGCAKDTSFGVPGARSESSVQDKRDRVPVAWTIGKIVYRPTESNTKVYFSITHTNDAPIYSSNAKMNSSCRSRTWPNITNDLTCSTYICKRPEGTKRGAQGR